MFKRTKPNMKEKKNTLTSLFEIVIIIYVESSEC